MKIKCNRYLKPFTHTPGKEILMPSSNLVLKIYPTRLEVIELEGSDSIIVQELPLAGPVADFTVKSDWQSQRVEVSGRSREGFFRYILYSKNGALICNVTKSPIMDLIKSDSVIKVKDWFYKADTLSWGYLTLGCFKQQDWDMVERRRDLREILPIWLRQTFTPRKRAVDGLLLKLEEAVVNKERESLDYLLGEVFNSHYHGIMVPHVEDSLYQGLENSTLLSSLELGEYMAYIIRKMFWDIDGDNIKILPVLPISLYCGKYVNITLGEMGSLDMEWSKKLIRRMVFRPTHDVTLNFVFSSAIKAFRLRNDQDKKSKQEYISGDMLSFKGGLEYYFDNFKK